MMSFCHHLSLSPYWFQVSSLGYHWQCLNLESGSDRPYLHDLLARIGLSLCEEYALGSEDRSEGDGTPGAFISRLSQFDCQTVTGLMKALIFGFISQPLTKNREQSTVLYM